ncbi:hypothetical protein SADUNF_Sadunf15G0075000 [Salix dunnii]|uniref:Terpene synthase metal-binding domain-containing protein n=1 Tax=Salix dunnii TaxID=1413687 RepID=A0A835JB47_9ROSI|nr:hypothetical protein SADUNF_Sadunf15G0075000 [Salix dunnii]
MTHDDSEIIRRTANFHQSIWGDQFVFHFTKDNKVHEALESEVEKLRDQVKREVLQAAACNFSSQSLDLIDAIQRLVVAYHFETEIEEALQHIYNNHINMEDGDLYNTALGFRLLRQHGYNVSSGVYFEPQYSLARKINTRVIAMTSIIDDIYDVYGTLEELELFIEAIDRWDTKSMDRLPDYMQICYEALLNVYSEIEEKVAKEGWSYRVHYGKQAVRTALLNLS